MKSIKEKLDIIARDSLDPTTQAIARQIVKGYYHQLFFSQKELASKAYTSISTITKFSQKIGFTGYRELVFSLKHEWQTYASSVLVEKFLDDKLEKNICNWTAFLEATLLENAKFIDSFLKHLRKTKKVFIFSSYQTQRNAELLCDLFTTIGIRVYYSFFRANDVVNAMKKEIEDATILALITGQDNAFLVDVLSSIVQKEEKRKNMFIIASESQQSKLTTFNELFVMPSSNPHNQYYSRSILLDLLFSLIHQQYKVLSK
ncbi:MurR/RpiR family transcriptional regulator [Williamsoniiplasma lucivorax]|uniref:HTH rpiR-type domain-containing protein n=1 Tax=Williamsoniiplasma lucivorax TaxID=209274 RepID=A0A2S5R9V6_9MOLU|nr:MurR/RpiR family transcriptional regulator [Williamsoniiplasma lucivorax]PPE04080.1 hypothetical protein ELUCI_v1c08600 [Williamsoniiplasma lucivorax]